MKPSLSHMAFIGGNALEKVSSPFCTRCFPTPRTPRGERLVRNSHACIYYVHSVCVLLRVVLSPVALLQFGFRRWKVESCIAASGERF
jgi:hypothetical protein